MPHSPLLPAAATGTVDTKSIVDPIRSHLDKSCNYYKAEALQINVKVGTPSIHALRAFVADRYGEQTRQALQPMPGLLRKN